MSTFLSHLAQTINAADNGIPPLSGDQFLTNTLDIVYFLAGTIAVIVIIIAGVTYTTSGGNAASVAKAKTMLIYGLVGVVVVALAFTITQFVIGRFK
jgi:hypothetical protein